MVKNMFAALFAACALLLVGCGGSGGDSSPVSGETLKGIWTATLDKSPRQVVCDLSVTNGQISGVMSLIDGEQSYTGNVTGTQGAGSVNFSSDLEGLGHFSFQTDRPLVVGQDLDGTFALGAGDHGQARFHHEGDERHVVSGDWAGHWASTLNNELSGDWNAQITQEGHNLSGDGKVLYHGNQLPLSLTGTIIGRHVAMGAAISGERVALWRGEIAKTDTGFTLNGRYVGKLVAGDRMDEGTLTGSGSGGGGHEGHLKIMPRHLVLFPGGIETLHASQAGVEWSQTSEEAQPGEFVDQREDAVRFRAPLIGGMIRVKATSKADPTVFGMAEVLVNGAAGRLGDHDFHTVLGAAAKVQRNGGTSFVVEFGGDFGAMRLMMPSSDGAHRFELTPEVTGITLTRKDAHFFANGSDGTAGFIEITRVSAHRLSGRFEATLKQREHPDVTVATSGVFDVGFVQP